MARKRPKSTRKRRKSKGSKGKVPLRVLENRLEKLNTIVKRRGGDYLD